MRQSYLRWGLCVSALLALPVACGGGSDSGSPNNGGGGGANAGAGQGGGAHAGQSASSGAAGELHAGAPGTAGGGAVAGTGGTGATAGAPAAGAPAAGAPAAGANNGGAGANSAGANNAGANNAGASHGGGGTSNAGANNGGGGTNNAGANNGGGGSSNAGGGSSNAGGGSANGGGGSANGGGGSSNAGGGSANGGGGSSNAGANNGGGGQGGGTAGSGGTGGAAQIGCASSTILDDMEDANGAICPHAVRAGGWFTAASGGVTATPTPTTSFNAYSLINDPRGSSQYGMRISGSGITGSSAWATLGASVTANPSVPYNATGYTAVRFWAKSHNVNLSVRCNLTTTETRSVANGGTCTGSCDDSYGAVVQFTPTWQLYYVDFASLTQGGWGTVVPKNLAHLITVEFNYTQVPKQGVSNPSSFEFLVDDVEFL